MRHWTPTELAQHLASDGEHVQMLDVREPWEYDIAQLDGSILIPLSKLAQESGNGFQTINLSGGIGCWAQELAPHMPLY